MIQIALNEFDFYGSTYLELAEKPNENGRYSLKGYITRENVITFMNINANDAHELMQQKGKESFDGKGVDEVFKHDVVYEKNWYLDDAEGVLSFCEDCMKNDELHHFIENTIAVQSFALAEIVYNRVKSYRKKGKEIPESVNQMLDIINNARMNLLIHRQPA